MFVVQINDINGQHFLQKTGFFNEEIKTIVFKSYEDAEIWLINKGLHKELIDNVTEYSEKEIQALFNNAIEIIEV